MRRKNYLKLAAYQTEQSKRHLDEVRSIHEEMRGYKHDFHHHLQTLKGQLESGEIRRALAYIEQLDHELMHVDTLLKTGNVSLDAILSAKIAQAKKEQIAVTLQAAVPDQLTITDLELSIVVGNLLDNAIEACRSVQGERFIRIYCQHLQKLFAYLDLPNHMYQGTLTVEKRDDNEYFVEFRNVSFQYPGSGQFALRHVNLRFQVGKKLAIVGMNGSGKTTFIKLLCRLYDPTEGEILLNGVDIRKYDYEEYLSLFSVVFQDFRLFSFGLGQNVAAGMNYDPSWARSCLMKAGFKDRLQKMPEGLDTCLYKDFEKNGVEISGGEAQKIALARALYKQAPFMVLDEPTAALDPMAEYEVYARMNEMVGGKTAIYISHRLASCRFCDMIAVFDQGQIVQQGTHEQLLAVETGKYHELWHAQAQYYV